MTMNYFFLNLRLPLKITSQLAYHEFWLSLTHTHTHKYEYPLYQIESSSYV